MLASAGMELNQGRESNSEGNMFNIRDVRMRGRRHKLYIRGIPAKRRVSVQIFRGIC